MLGIIAASLSDMMHVIEGSYLSMYNSVDIVGSTMHHDINYYIEYDIMARFYFLFYIYSGYAVLRNEHIIKIENKHVPHT